MTKINQYKLTDEIYQLPEISNFPTKDVHIVCPALKKNSLCSYLLVNKCDMDIAEVGKLCDAVNYKQETGCLFPRYHLTLFPTYDALKDLDIERACEGIVKDIMKANAEYYKNTKILFVIDDLNWFEYQRFSDLLKKHLVGKFDKALKEIQFYIS